MNIQPKFNKEYQFKPFDKVLVRCYNDSQWQCTIFSHTIKVKDKLMYVCTNKIWNECIPFEGNEHLVGTTDTPNN